MAIPISNLKISALRFYAERRYGSLAEARRYCPQTAFLSHSHKDRELAKGLQVYLREKGWAVYIDWEDKEMPSQPSRETAQRIQSKIKECNWFLLLATENSTMKSRWCPWEIGYADGATSPNKIWIVPTSSNSTTYGSEYLGLYKRIDVNSLGQTQAFDAGQFGYYARGTDLRMIRPMR